MATVGERVTLVKAKAAHHCQLRAIQGRAKGKVWRVRRRGGGGETGCFNGGGDLPVINVSHRLHLEVDKLLGRDEGGGGRWVLSGAGDGSAGDGVQGAAVE